MAKIFTFGNTKGGVGKSTNAVQAALAFARDGKRVWLVDGDRQGTSQTAITVRAEANLSPMIAASAYPEGATLRTQVMQQRDNYDYIIIDAGGRDSTALRAALVVSDAVLIPFLPRTFDVWAFDDIAKLLDEARAVNDIRAIAFLNMADPQGTDNEDAAAALLEFPGIELAPFRLNRRKAYAHSSGAGRHVSEAKPKDPRAVEEFGALYDWMKNI
jgi:chromosome partitioning protein